MRDLIRRHRIVSFFVLAFLLSWYPWFIALKRGTTTGPNPLGPFVAAMVIAAISSGMLGVRKLLAKLVLWRVEPGWYLVAVGLPLLICSLAAVITIAVGHGSMKIPDVAWKDIVERFIFIFFFVALGEEPGWRGFALPELQLRYSPAIATSILAAVWAVWHLPLIGTEFPLSIVPAFALSLFGGAFVQTWLFNRTRGSVLLQMILHATVNTAGAGLVFPCFSGGDVTILWWSYAALWVAAGVASVVAFQTVRLHAEATTKTADG